MSSSRDEVKTDPRTSLPSVSVVLESPVISDLMQVFPRAVVTDFVRRTLAEIRQGMGDEGSPTRSGGPDAEGILQTIRGTILAEHHERIRRVVNATGIVLHTGLGRSVLPTAAARALLQTDRNVNLQIDLATGARGKRNYLTERLLCWITGAEAALVVNNNAAATMLVLAVLCAGREVVVSRGQLIEIGGSYRLPDCIHQAGAVLVEVGTTNKTHVRDYEAALGERTGAILHVNPSNYRIIGFTKDIPIAELVSLKRRRDVLVIDDLGCGALVDLSRFGLPREPMVQDSVAAGADLVCFSGDKLIGGPQAGIIVGRRTLIDAIKKTPLTRMLRVGKLTDIALEHTLRLFLEPEKLADTHPVYEMLARPYDLLARRARSIATALHRACPGTISAEVIAGESEVGGGTLPGVSLRTALLAITHAQHGPDRVSALLRGNEPPIVATIRDGRVCLDMRTLLPGDERIIREAMCRIGPAADRERPSA